MGDPGAQQTPGPGHTTGPNDNPNGSQPGGNGGNPDPAGGAGGNPLPGQTPPDDGNTTPADPPVASKPLVAVVHPNRLARASEAPYVAWVFTVTIKNPGTEDVSGWTLDLQLADTDLKGKVDDGSISISRSGDRARLTSDQTIPAGEKISFHLLVEGTDASVVVGCAIDGKTARCDVG